MNYHMFGGDYLDRIELKKKIRALKKQELLIRGNVSNLVWETYFRNMYPIDSLLRLSDEDRKHVVEDYFISVYMLYYREIGESFEKILDPSLLQTLGLSNFATLDDVKKRFRQLAMEHHPDHGGDSTIFRYYMDIYNQLKQT